MFKVLLWHKKNLRNERVIDIYSYIFSLFFIFHYITVLLVADLEFRNFSFKIKLKSLGLVNSWKADLLIFITILVTTKYYRSKKTLWLKLFNLFIFKNYFLILKF